MKKHFRFESTLLCIMIILSSLANLTVTASSDEFENDIIVKSLSTTDVLGGGNGTKENPYQIRTEDEFNIISDIPNAYYILKNDITLSKNFRPLCILGDEFSGEFDGKGYTINNLTITDYYEYSGLFGTNSGTIKNLNVNYSTNGANYEFYTDTNFGGIVGYNEGRIENCKVSLNVNLHSSDNPTYTTTIGGIVGENYYSGEIINCNVNGQINVSVTSANDESQQLYQGGISGRNLNIIEECNVNVDINNDITSDGYNYVYSYIGGISGFDTGIINNSDGVYDINIGKVSNATIGGIVGSGSSYTIENVSSNGKITSTALSINAGGIVGSELSDSEGNISRATSKLVTEISEVYYYSRLGGIAGFLNSKSVICQSCSDIDFTVSKTSDVIPKMPYLDCGGIVGTGYGNINNCFSKGNVELNINKMYSGGIVGNSGSTLKINNSYAVVSGVKYGLTYPNGTVVNSVYDTGISECSDTGYGEPKTTLGMKMETVYKNLGWDFEKIWNISSSINVGYPYLINVKKLTPDLNVLFTQTSSLWNFDISNDTHIDSAAIYIGIYDKNGKLLAITSKDMIPNDVTSISIPKVDNYSYANVFEWVDMKPVTNLKTILLNQ